MRQPDWGQILGDHLRRAWDRPQWRLHRHLRASDGADRGDSYTLSIIHIITCQKGPKRSTVHTDLYPKNATLISIEMNHRCTTMRRWAFLLSQRHGERSWCQVTYLMRHLNFKSKLFRRQVCSTSNPCRPRARNHGQCQVTPLIFFSWIMFNLVVGRFSCKSNTKNTEKIC